MEIPGVRSFLIAAICMVALSPCIIAQSPFQPSEEEQPRTPVKKKFDKIDFTYRASEGYLAAATWLDVSTTVRGLDRPTMAYRTNDTFLMRYVVSEAGWTKCFGDRNSFAASAGNGLLNAGITEISRRMYRRGGRWRIAAVVLVTAKATTNAFAGFQNRALQADIDSQVRKSTGYRGVIVWRSH